VPTDYSEEIAREVSALYLAAERSVARRHPSIGRPLEKLSLHVLGRLLDSGPMRPSALAQLVRLDLSTVSRHIAALEAGDLAAREPDPRDRRAWLVRLTPAGADAAVALRARRRERMGRILADWSDADRADLARLLARLNADITRVDEESLATAELRSTDGTTA
jgi:DNA-binding MarR family transcriptional regulator